MSHIYVPVDYSNIREHIPDNQEILYSSLCNLTVSGLGKRQKSHLIATKSGIHFTAPKRKGRVVYEFVSWIKIRKFKKTRIQYKIGLIWVDLKVRRDEKFESKMDFNQRSKLFGPTLKQISMQIM